MKKELNPVVAGIIVAILLGGIAFWFYTKAGGKTFSKSESRGGFGIRMDPPKVQGGAGQ